MELACHLLLLGAMVLVVGIGVWLFLGEQRPSVEATNLANFHESLTVRYTGSRNNREKSSGRGAKPRHRIGNKCGQ
jgi:hypothetical protein